MKFSERNDGKLGSRTQLSTSDLEVPTSNDSTSASSPGWPTCGQASQQGTWGVSRVRCTATKILEQWDVASFTRTWKTPALSMWVIVKV